jgi:hypothetical protein
MKEYREEMTYIYTALRRHLQRIEQGQIQLKS